MTCQMQYCPRIFADLSAAVLPKDVVIGGKAVNKENTSEVAAPRHFIFYSHISATIDDRF